MSLLFSKLKVFSKACCQLTFQVGDENMTLIVLFQMSLTDFTSRHVAKMGEISTDVHIYVKCLSNC